MAIIDAHSKDPVPRGDTLPQKDERLRAIDSPASILALVLVATVTEAMFLVLPSFVGALTDELRLSTEQTGLLGSADLIGIALATASAPRWLRSVSWRGLTMSSLGSFLAVTIVCFGVRAYFPLLLLRLLAGVSAGIAYAIALAGLIDTRKAARNAALMICMQIVFRSLGVFVLDSAPPGWRLDAVYGYILVWLLPTLWITMRFGTADPGQRPRSTNLLWRQVGLPGIAVVAGTGLYYLMLGAVWGHLEGIARSAGLSLDQTGTALSLGTIISFSGSCAAAWLGVRYGRIAPLLAAGTGQLVALILLTRISGLPDAVYAFFVVNCVFQLFWSYVTSYFIVIFNDIDRSGRFVSFFGTAAHISLAIGPYIGAMLVVNGNHTPLLWFGIAALVLAYASFLFAARTGPR